MVFGFSYLEQKVSLAMTQTAMGFPNRVEMWRNMKADLTSMCKKYDWVDTSVLNKALDFFHLATSFYLVIDDTNASSTIQKIQKYLKAEFIKRFELDESQLDGLMYSIEIVIRAINDSDADFPKNYMPANAFWDIYDGFTNAAHKSPSKTGFEVEFSNTTVRYREFTLKDVDLSKLLATFWISALDDSTNAYRKLR